MYTLDDINVYILNWKKVSHNSLDLYNRIKHLINNITIINCDENLILDNSIRYIQLDDSHYYGSQYEYSIRDVKENAILCIIIGDNIPDNNFNILFTCALETFNNYNIGVYAPNDKRSPHKEFHDEIGPKIFNVPNTDCSFWFIHPSIIQKLKYLNYSISKFGWGIDIITIKEAKKNGLLVVRDYRCETDQLDYSTNYDSKEAEHQMHKLIEEYKNLK